MILNDFDLIRVQTNTAKKMLPTNEYLTYIENENFKYIKNRFFAGESIDKIKTLNVGSNLFGTITNVVGDYVGNPVIDLEFPIKNLVTDYLTLGFGTLTLEKINGNLKPVYQPAEKHFKRDGIDYILRIYQTYEEYKTTYYYLITSFDKGIIENHLYETVDLGLNNLKEVELITIQETSNLLQRINTGLEKCFFVIQEDVLEQFPISIIDKITNTVYSIERKLLMLDLQLLQNVESFILLKGIQLPIKLFDKYNENGKISFQDLGRIVQGDEGSSIEFISNSNSLIDKTFENNEIQLKQISSITTIPLDFLGGVGTAGAIGEGSRELLHGAFLKTILGIRNLFDKTIMEFLRIAKIDDQYQWDDIFIRNQKEVTEEIKIARELMILSRYNAIKRYNDYSDEETQTELDLINLEINNVENGNQSDTDTEANNVTEISNNDIK